MKNINIDIKRIVHKNLNETRELKMYNSYYKLRNKKGDELFDSFMETSIKLMNEGYDVDEINSFLFEDMLPSSLSDKINDIDWKGGMTDALVSTLKEMAYYWILTALGFKHSNAMLISSFIKDLTILDVLRPFKDKQNCINYGPKLMDAFLEAIVRWGGRKLTGLDAKNETWGDVLTSYIGNTVGTIIEKSDTSETLVKKLCPLIHK
jgi:hypothetical protein